VKAVLHTHYGSPDLLELREVDKPIPRANEVLIAIHATTVSTGDCNVRNFTFVTKSMRPIAKLMFGIRRPWKERILGTELAGEVEGVGKDVTRFKTGDRIMASTAMAGGGHAQYGCLPEAGAVVIKPDSLSWEQAVALPFGANTALHFLRNLGKIRAGQELLIIGASGAIGSAGVQLAKHFAAKVTGVCSGANVELVKTLGADTAIDYTRNDFTKNGKTYDLIFDVVGATTHWLDRSEPARRRRSRHHSILATEPDTGPNLSPGHSLRLTYHPSGQSAVRNSCLVDRRRTPPSSPIGHQSSSPDRQFVTRNWRSSSCRRRDSVSS